VSSQRNSDLRSEDLEGSRASLNVDIVFDPRELTIPATLKHAVMGNAIMEMLEQILCERGNVDYVHKFATTITNKWTLLFIENAGNPYGAVLAMRILARLLYTQGPAYVTKFRASYGFLVLQSYIPQFWNVVPMVHVVISILLGVDVCEVPLRAPMDNETLHLLYGDSIEAFSRLSCPDILPTLMTILRNGVAAAVTPSGAHGKMTGAVQGRTTKVVETYQTLIEFFTEMQASSRIFKEIFVRPEFIDELAAILFPFICHSTKAMAVELELDYIASEPASRHNQYPSSASSAPVEESEATTTKPASGRSSEHSSVSSFIASEVKTVDSDSVGESGSTPVTSTRSESPTNASASKSQTAPAASASSSLSLTTAQTSSLNVSQTFSEGTFRRTPSSVNMGRVRDVDLKIVQEPIALSILKLFVVICIDSVLDSAPRSMTAVDLLLQSCPPAYKGKKKELRS